MQKAVGENRASWLDKLNDALWAFHTAYKTLIGFTPYKLVYGKACHLPIELEHKAYWALKHANFNLKTAGDHRKLQINELNELHDQAYENSLIYKEKSKRLHDSKIKNRVFNIGDRVLLFNSRLKIFSGKLKSRWSGPFTISHVFPYGTVELTQPDGPNFKVNGYRLKKYFGEDTPKWFGIQLNPNFLGVDLKFFFVRAGMMGWLLINLSVLAKSIQDSNLSQSMILYQIFCVIYIMDYLFYEEYMTSTWDIIAERLGFMLVFGDLVWIPFTFSIQGWWLMSNKVELTTAAVVANCCVFVIGYLVFRGANKQKHDFKKNPKALFWGQSPKVIGGKLLVSGYWGIARHCNYLGDLLLALSFSLPCGISSPVPYFYPIYLLILLIWRERRDEARCAEKYKEMLVSPNQSAFVSGRSISDNILLTQELMHNYHLDRGVSRCAFKVDIQKAYDTVDWDFLKVVLNGFGFHDQMVSWIMECVSTTSFSIIINGSLHGYFKGKKGLRQGDPLSPYLFTLIMEFLTLMLQRRVRDANIFTYHIYCLKLELINLCFADDLFLFAHGDVNSVKVIKDDLDEFKNSSGLTPSLPKARLISVMFLTTQVSYPPHSPFRGGTASG
nr:delta(14)-sterol reductase [Tanacetum cinerariifolium]